TVNRSTSTTSSSSHIPGAVFPDVYTDPVMGRLMQLDSQSPIFRVVPAAPFFTLGCVAGGQRVHLHPKLTALVDNGLLPPAGELPHQELPFPLQPAHLVNVAALNSKLICLRVEDRLPRVRQGFTRV